MYTRAQSWDEGMAARQVLRPANIQGIEILDRLRQLEELVCPFHLVVPAILARQTPEETSEGKAQAQIAVIASLESFGY